MSRPEAILNDIRTLNDHYWAKIGPLERKLLEVEDAFKAASEAAPRGSPVDVIGRGLPAAFLAQLHDLAAKINALYAEWERRLTFINPPKPGPKPSADFASKIPWPGAVPPGVRKRLTRVIEQGGIPLSKRVQIIPARGPFGGTGVAVEFAKW